MSPGTWGPGRDDGLSSMTLGQGGVFDICGSAVGSDEHLGKTKDTLRKL